LKKTRQGAFTLIELLVVIAVIALLAALLMPAFRVVLESGRTTKCASNLRQIGVGMFLYSQDHSGFFPESGVALAWGAIDSGTGGSGQPSWMQQLGPYVSGTADPKTLGPSGTIFTCPSSSLLTGSYPADQYYSYFNGAHAAYAANGNQAAPVRRTAIVMPAEQILSGDITDWPANGVNDSDKVDNSQNPIDKLSAFHNGTVNILYADGHVAAAHWNTSLLSYFDPTQMATHYPGTINPATSGSNYTGYLTP